MPKITTQEFFTINDIPDTTFRELGCDQTFYFSKLFLASFEEANNTIDYRYLVFMSREKPIAIAILQRVRVSLESASNNLPYYQKLAKSVQCYLSNKKTHILVCGNVFLSGEYGIWVKQGIDRRRIYDMLSRKLKTLQKATKSSVCFLKDFNATQDTAASVVEKQHFQSFAVEPNMHVNVAWKDFKDYKSSLKSKYRIKVNKADSSSSALVQNSLTANEIRTHKEKLKSLYLDVAGKALFNTAFIDIETYALLKERFPENVIISTYSKKGEIVGFSTAFLHDEQLSAHYVGLDYTVNKTDAIYPRMLNDYIRLGLLLGVKDINLGRTASEIKSTLGATPEHLRCYIKHRRTVANMFFKPFIRQIKMTEYKQHNPFKI
ncbi:peptidogalycan biosysnthesis protein [uncultured Dokdonia sp.]|uniref:peptidogalycan biosysnthesis protein n=1 Tax=uncultured Dokdonia sp. TaxID=575653 RepID=UPI0030EECE47